MDTRLVNPHDCQYVQSRVALDVFAVAEYEEMMERGIVFEPCKGILCDDGAIIIYDGNHRAEAAKGNGAMIEVELTPGTAQDADWQASGANTRHGIRRTASDIEKSVKAALRHPNAQDQSDREIARHCGCDHKTVGKYRKELESSGERPQIPVKTVTRNGTEYQMTIPMAKEPEPEPVRNPSPVVYDEHMRPTPQKPQAKASMEGIQDLIKTWLFDVYGYDVETAREKLHSAICAPIQHAEHFHALAAYVEARLICTRSDIRQACQALLDNTAALRPGNAHQWEKQNLVTQKDTHGLYDELRCARCGVTVKHYGLGPVLYNDPCVPVDASPDVQETPASDDDNPFDLIDAMPTVPGVNAQGHTGDRKVIEARCMDCGEPFPRPEDRPDLHFCYECGQARLQERERLTEVHQRHGLIPSPEPETPNEIIFICDFCGKMLPESQVYNVFQRKDTANIIKASICAKCVMIAAKEITRYDDIAKPYSCPDCGYKFQAVAVKCYADDVEVST